MSLRRSLVREATISADAAPRSAPVRGRGPARAAPATGNRFDGSSWTDSLVRADESLLLESLARPRRKPGRTRGPDHAAGVARDMVIEGFGAANRDHPLHDITRHCGEEPTMSVNRIVDSIVAPSSARRQNRIGGSRIRTWCAEEEWVIHTSVRLMFGGGASDALQEHIVKGVEVLVI